MKKILTLKYEGGRVESGQMDAYETAKNIIAFTEFMTVVAGAAYGENVKLATKVQGFKQGSFSINFLLEAGGILSTLLSGGLDPNQMPDLIKDSFEAWKHLKGQPPESMETQGDKIVVKNCTGEVKVFKADTINIVVNEDAGKAVERFVKEPLLNNLDDVYVDTGGERIAAVSQGEAAFFVPAKVSVPMFENTIRQGLYLESAVFKEGNMWKFSDGSSSFSARIEDKGFLAKVENGEERFGKGDILIVDLKITQTRTIGKINTDRSVTKVYEHRLPGQQESFLM